MRTSDVFGISTRILPSYIDRGRLDSVVKRDLSRPKHLAIRGESKCGKSWIRQKILPDAIVVQCRLGKDLRELYKDIFSQLDIRVSVETTSSISTGTTFSAETEGGLALIAKLRATLGLNVSASREAKEIIVGRDVDDLRFISQVVKESGRRLVIEDFHYLDKKVRAAFAHDLKTLWDYEVYAVVIGIWTDKNMLVHLCPDLANRITERSIFWTEADLINVVETGQKQLNLEFDREVIAKLVADSFNTVGLLQNLVLGYLDELEIFESNTDIKSIDDQEALTAAAMEVADQLNAVYQTFAQRVVKGMRRRKNSTGIYAHTLKVVMESSDNVLNNGISADTIFEIAHSRESRIQKPNLKQILEKIDELQVDDDGRGLILSYVPSQSEVTVVDRQLFFYRKYATIKWPWDEVIDSLGPSETSFSIDEV